MTFHLDLKDEQIKLAIEDAVLRLLDDNAREAIIRQALAFLSTPTKDYRGMPASTPLAAWFEETCRFTVGEIARGLLAPGTDMRAQLDAHVTEALRAYLTERESRIARAIGAGIADALKTKESYD